MDTFGVGADHALACIDKLRELNSTIEVYSLNTGDPQKVVDPMFLNPRSELGWEFRRLLQNDMLLIPQEPELKWQIRELRQKPHRSGRLHLEPKDIMHKRIGRSPDDLDATLLTLYGDTATADPGAFNALNS